MSVSTWGEKTQQIMGPAGLLDLRVGKHEGASAEELKCGFIMCHPHPLFSGTMDNKVVTTLVRGAAQLGLGTLRFNFRGVGDSAGEHGHGLGEQDDLAAVVNYAIKELGWKKIYLAGFSFGSGVACLYAGNHPEQIAGLFLVAPAVHHFDAPSLLPFEFETHVYMGDADEVVPFDEVEHWVDLLTPQPHFHIFEETSHFFHGKLVLLKNTVLDDLERLRG